MMQVDLCPLNSNYFVDFLNFIYTLEELSVN